MPYMRISCPNCWNILKCESESLIGDINPFIALGFGMHAAKHFLVSGVASVLIILIIFSGVKILNRIGSASCISNAFVILSTFPSGLVQCCVRECYE